MKQAFIFDFDGVIVDSERLWRDIGDKEFYPSLVPGWTVEDGAKMMGHGIKAGFDRLVTLYGLQMEYEEYLRRVDELTDEIYMSRLELLPGIRELITRVTEIGMKIAIASSGNHDWIESVLVRKDLRETFSVICASEDVNDRTKPNPDVYLLAAERLGVSPAGCIALEDSFNGLTAAKTAGMVCLAIRTDMSALQDLSQADRIIAHYDELTEEVLRSL